MNNENIYLQIKVGAISSCRISVYDYLVTSEK